MTAHSVLNVRAAPEWGNSELYRYYERNGLGYGTVQPIYDLQKKAKKFKWTHKAKKAFNEIKKAINKPTSFKSTYT